MKAIIIALLVAAATAVPVPDDSGPVEVIVNGVPEGHGLDIGHIVDVEVHKQVNGEAVAVENVLHPFSSAGIIEAALAAEGNNPVAPDPVIVVEEPTVPDVVSPVIVVPEVVPDPVVLPEPVSPEVVGPVTPEVVPDPVVLPEPVSPEVVGPVIPEVINPIAPEVVGPVKPEVINPVAPEVVGPAEPEVVVLPEELPTGPAEELPVPSGIIYNDGVVDVTMNGPSDYNVMGTLKNWFNVVLNYITSGGQQVSSQQIL